MWRQGRPVQGRLVLGGLISVTVAVTTPHKLSWPPLILQLRPPAPPPLPPPPPHSDKHYSEIFLPVQYIFTNQLWQTFLRHVPLKSSSNTKPIFFAKKKLRLKISSKDFGTIFAAAILLCIIFISIIMMFDVIL